jgi:polar amino acid transport system substrate-binding protein
MKTGARRVSGNGKRSAAARAVAILMGTVLLAAAAGCSAAGAPRATGAARNLAARDGAHTTTHRTTSGKARAKAPPACDPTAASLRPPPGTPRITPSSWMATIRQRGHLIAGVSASTYGFGYFNPINGQYQGFDIDMIKAVATAIFGTADGHIEYKSITDDQRQGEITSGSVDIVAETMTINCKRLKVMDFSSVYFDANTRVLVLKNSTATGLASLGGQKVCATKGSTSAGIISSYPVTPRLKLVAVPQFTDCLVLLQQGQIAAISTDDAILAGLKAQDPFTKIVGPPFDPQPYGLAISQQHPDFVQFVNAVLAQERADGGWAHSYATWVGTPVPAPPPAHYAD